MFLRKRGLKEETVVKAGSSVFCNYHYGHLIGTAKSTSQAKSEGSN